jgi:hypothetical protein
MLVDHRLGSLRADPRLSIWNPLRDHSPELAGHKYLRQIQSAGCQETLTSLPLRKQEKVTACDKQRRIPLKDTCRLIERSDVQSSVWLLFQCEYQLTPGFIADVDITLKREGSGWILDSYERID